MNRINSTSGIVLMEKRPVKIGDSIGFIIDKEYLRIHPKKTYVLFVEDAVVFYQKYNIDKGEIKLLYKGVDLNELAVKENTN